MTTTEIEEMAFFTKSFKDKFGHCFDKRIVLYGINRVTLIIISAYPEANIIGVMEKDYACSRFAGKPVLCEGDLCEERAEIMIIIGRKDFIVENARLFRKTAESCHLKVYSLQGYSAPEYPEIRTCYRYMLEDLAIDKCQNTYKNTVFEGLLIGRKSKSDEIVLSLISNRMEKMSVLPDTRRVVSDISDFAYCIIGPLVTSYVLFLIEKIEQEEFDKILFASRDSYLIQRLYDKAKKKRTHYKKEQEIYFYSSRNACISATMFREEDFLYFENYSNIDNMHEITAYRFGLKEKLDKYNPEKFGDVYGYYNYYKDILIEASSRNRENYKKYMEKCGIAPGEKVAFVDLVSMGTCPALLSRIMDNEIHCYFLGKYNDYNNYGNRCMLKTDALYTRLDSPKSETFSPYIFHHYWLLETVMSSPEPSLHHFDDAGNPVFCRESRNDQRIEDMLLMQQGIESFFDDYLNSFDNIETLDSNLSERIYRMSSSAYFDYSKSSLRQLELFEDLGQRLLVVSLEQGDKNDN